MTVQMNLFTSCMDDMAADSYYTFTGEMMSDYLQNREDFSLFCRIVERAGWMDFLSSRGSRTFFPPTNDGVEAALADLGYSSVEDIPTEYCDTLVKACLIDGKVLYTYDMSETQQETNELELPLIIVTDGSVKDDDSLTVSVINSNSGIINNLKNDSVDNGVVHPVDYMLVPNTSLGASLLEENQEGNFGIFYEAFNRTNLLVRLAEYRDEDYETWKEDYAEIRTGIYSGGRFSISDAGYLYYARRPDHLYTAFTVLVVPDEVLYEKYPDYFSADNTMDENIQGLYNLAVEKYSDESSAEIFGLTDEIKEQYWNMESLENEHNPLHMFMAYHIIDRMFESTATLINCWGTNTNLADPVEWVTTLLDFSMIKLEKVYQTVDPTVEHNAGFYLNRAVASLYNDYVAVPGAYLTTPSGGNFSLNCAYYYIDNVLAYDATMRDNVMNTRIRMDMSTLWPELTNNGIRLAGSPTTAYNSEDYSENTLNYYIPPGYLANTEVSENTIFFVQRPKVEWWNWGGDEFNFLGTSYDIKFRLPCVPPGTYELRMGYAGMIDRGIAQIYFDGSPQGIPVDLRYQANDSRVGGIYGDEWDALSDDEKDDNRRTMKNNGYYRGGASLYSYNGGASSRYNEPTYEANYCSDMDDNSYTYRRKLCDVVVEAQTHHEVRVRSVWVQGNSGCFMIDYIELVPFSICGAGGLGEDNL